MPENNTSDANAIDQMQYLSAKQFDELDGKGVLPDNAVRRDESAIVRRMSCCDGDEEPLRFS